MERTATPDLVLLQVAIYNDISVIFGADLNIDGNKVKLYATKVITDFDSSSMKESVKSFSTKLLVVRDIVNSKKDSYLTPTSSIETLLLMEKLTVKFTALYSAPCWLLFSFWNRMGE